MALNFKLLLKFYVHVQSNLCTKNQPRGAPIKMRFVVVVFHSFWLLLTCGRCSEVVVKADLTVHEGQQTDISFKINHVVEAIQRSIFKRIQKIFKRFQNVFEIIQFKTPKPP
jgi:hypothetical protein